MSYSLSDNFTINGFDPKSDTSYFIQDLLKAHPEFRQYFSPRNAHTRREKFDERAEQSPFAYKYVMYGLERLFALAEENNRQVRLVTAEHHVTRLLEDFMSRDFCIDLLTKCAEKLSPGFVFGD
jgi:hypothetical protein